MEHNQDRGANSSRKSESQLSLDGFDSLYVFRVETALRPGTDNIRESLSQLYEEYNSWDSHHMTSGESTTIEAFRTPFNGRGPDLDQFTDVATEVRGRNQFFTDVVTIAKLSETAVESLSTGEYSPGDPQQSIDKFLDPVDTICSRYRQSTEGSAADADIDGLPVTSCLVAVPESTPLIRDLEEITNPELAAEFRDTNKQLFDQLGFSTGPQSIVVPDDGNPFLMSTQAFSSPLGPYGCLYFPLHGRESGGANLSVRDLRGIESLISVFRRFNWLRHRSAQVNEAETHFLRFNERVESIDDQTSIVHPPDLEPFEELISEIRTDATVLARIDEELRVLGNPYREATSLGTEINETHPLPDNGLFAEVLGDCPIEQLREYFKYQEPFLSTLVDRTQKRQQTARESLLAEVSISATRQNLRLQRILLALTAVLLILTVVMAYPTARTVLQ